MKRLVLSGAPRIKKLIESLREATAAVFNALIFNSVRAATSEESLDEQRVAEIFVGRIELYRTGVSSYVTLLKELESSFDELVTAFQQPRNAVSLAVIVQRYVRLSATADAWGRSYLSQRPVGY